MKITQRLSFAGKFTLIACVFTDLISTSHGTDLDMFPGDDFENAVENLSPGDVLTVHQGTYSVSGRVGISVKGTSSSPVVIQAAPGEARPQISRPAGSSTQNTINIEGAEHLTIVGLEITSNGGDGINMSNNPSYITLEDLEVHDIAVGINFRSDMHHITVRGNHIYNTSDTGEGMYVGCNFATCAVSESIIENNWIHDTLAANQGDGIEVKAGSHSNIIRNNVIHDTNYPCILLYGTDGNTRNLVEGNVMWNCGDSGIQAAADAVIRNNIILQSPGNGFNSQSHQGVDPANLEFVHNTVIGGNPCLRMLGWADKPGMVFANNAVYCESGSFSVDGLTGVAIAGNVFEPATGTFPDSGYIVGRSEAQDFIDAVNKDVYPTSDSPVVGAGDQTYAAVTDFNDTERLGGVDAGAYAWTGPQNPGWKIAQGFKQGSPGPTLTFSTIPSAVEFQGEAELTWTAGNVDVCNASGAWNGPKLLAGVETVGPLTADSTYTLACTTDAANSISRTVTVIVNDLPVVTPTMTFTAENSSVPMNGSTMLSWSSTDTDNCVAGGAWTGSKLPDGSESTGRLTANSSFTLTCNGPGGSVNSSIVVTIQSGDPDPMEPADQDNSTGAGSTGLALLLLLYPAIRRIRRRSAETAERGSPNREVQPCRMGHVRLAAQSSRAIGVTP